MNYLEEMNEILNFIDTEVDLISISDSNNRKLFSAALYTNTLDHARAIQILLQNQSYPSAFSLQRVVFESYVRGAWLHLCANELQIDFYKRNIGIRNKTSDTKDISFKELVRQVETKANLPDYFSVIRDRAWHAMNSYTHSGILQISRCIKGNLVTHNYPTEEAYEIMELAAIFACFAFAGLLDLSGKESEALTNTLLEKTLSWKNKFSGISYKIK